MVVDNPKVGDTVVYTKGNSDWIGTTYKVISYKNESYELMVLKGNKHIETYSYVTGSTVGLNGLFSILKTVSTRSNIPWL